MQLIVVAGPAGAGKTTWAENYANENDVFSVHTDEFLDTHRDARPGLVAARLSRLNESVVVLEGVEALRTVSKAGLTKQVVRVVWIDGPEKPGTAGLTTQQKIYLKRLHGRIPAVEIVKRNA